MCKSSQKKLLASVLFFALTASTQASAQTITVEQVNAVSTGTSVEVDWALTDGGVLEGVLFTIGYDNAVFTPDLSNCLLVEDADNTSCAIDILGGQNVVKVGLLNFNPGDLLGAASGTITFTYASGATLGEYPLTLTEDVNNTEPASTSITLNNGKITMQAAPAPALSVSPTTGTFTAANGSTDTKSFTVTNSGNAGGLTVTNAALSGTNASNYLIASNTCPTSAPGVAQGATCTIQVTFTANAVSTFNASLDLTSNGGNESVALSGIGTLGPAGEITITPAGPFDFGDVLTGVDTGTQIFTVTNTGAVGSVVTISTAELNTSGAPYSITTNTCLVLASVQLEKDETCAVTVEFKPTTDGVQTRTLTVSGTDGNATAQSDFVAMTGEGVTEPRPTSDPEAGSTQSQVVGPQGDHDFTVVFGNDGNAPYDISCGLDEGDTDIWDVANGAITTVAPGGTHTVTTTCSLPDTETYTATLSCSYGGREFEINLPTFTYSYECVGLPPLPIPVNNQWALVLLTLMLLMAAGFGFRFIARQ